MRRLVMGLVLVASACGSVEDKPADASVADGVSDSASGMDAPLSEVSGTVLDVFGTPLLGAMVRIGSETVTTAGDGQFHFAAVPPSYDLDVVTSEPGGLKRVTGYRGLTSRSPEVGVSAIATQTTPLSGTTSGVSFPLPANQHLILADTEQYFGFDQPTVAEITSTSFNGTAVWFGKPTFQGTLWALHYTQVGSQITAYNAYARYILTLTAGTPRTVSISTTPISTSTLTGAVTTLPPGTTSASVGIVLKHASDPFGHSVGGTSTSGAFSLPTPAGPSLMVNVVAEAGTVSGAISTYSYVWKANLPSNATNVNLALGAPPSFNSPANGSTGIKGNATFSWSPGTLSGVYKLVIDCAAGANYAATIFTTATSVSLPETATLGANWPNAKACTWELIAFGATSVDTVVATNGLNKLERFNGPVDGAWSRTTGYGFTTE